LEDEITDDRTNTGTTNTFATASPATSVNTVSPNNNIFASISSVTSAKTVVLYKLYITSL